MIGEYCLTVHQCILADIDPAMGKMDIQNESATFMFSYILCYILVLLAQKNLQIFVYIIIYLYFFLIFFFFTKYIQICMCLVSIKQTHAHKNRKSKYVPLCQNILKLTANFFHLSFEGKTTNAYICFGFLI